MTDWYPADYPSEIPTTVSNHYPDTEGRPAGAVWVWSYTQGVWRAGNGYRSEHIIGISSMDHLIVRLRAKKLEKQVGRLAILAHGDFQGQLALPASATGTPAMMSLSTLGSYSAQLTALKGFLAPNADVIFFSCITGRGSPGDEFLKALSNKLPGRRVIAFTTIVWYSLFPSTAGQVKDSGVHQRILAPRKESSYTGEPNVGPNSANAKWAKDGKIRRLAHDDERLGKPKPTPKADPIWLNKELSELRCNPGPFMSLKRKLEKQGKYYYVTREDLEGCKK